MQELEGMSSTMVHLVEMTPDRWDGKPRMMLCWNYGMPVPKESHMVIGYDPRCNRWVASTARSLVYFDACAENVAPEQDAGASVDDKWEVHSKYRCVGKHYTPNGVHGETVSMNQLALDEARKFISDREIIAEYIGDGKFYVMASADSKVLYCGVGMLDADEFVSIVKCEKSVSQNVKVDRKIEPIAVVHEFVKGEYYYDSSTSGKRELLVYDRYNSSCGSHVFNAIHGGCLMVSDAAADSIVRYTGRTVTYRELAAWLGRGIGECLIGGECRTAIRYRELESGMPCSLNSEDIKVRKFGADHWSDPTDVHLGLVDHC